MSLMFPKDFKFGIADADLQVIGEKNTIGNENSEPTMWGHFAKTSGKCYQNQTPEVGIDRYHMWESDISIMESMGVKHYRTSVSMSRILKKNGDVNKKAVEWYRKYFKGLKKIGVNIYTTLYHWELPQYLSEIGGWKNLKSAEYLAKHASAVAENLGEYIEEYFIFNEARHVAIRGYYEGFHAPGEKNLKGALLAAHNILIAHALTYNALHTVNKNVKIGTVFSLSPSYAYSLDKQDLLAAKYSNAAKNLWFTDPFFLGKYPDLMINVYGKNMPKVSDADMKFVKIGSNFYSVGVNYYKGTIVKYDSQDDRKFKEVSVKNGPTNDLGWPIYMPPYYPEGLYDLLNQTYFSYKNYGLKKIYVTENGMALKTPWDGKSGIINDDKRIKYLKEHLRQIYNAILRGIPVEGYFPWTLMDNYEWPEGYRPESSFGLFHIDRKTMKRIPKKSALWYADLIKTKILQN